MAAAASPGFGISTNPKPLEWPVVLSLTIEAELTAPNSLKSSANFSSPKYTGKLRTRMFMLVLYQILCLTEKQVLDVGGCFDSVVDQRIFDFVEFPQPFLFVLFLLLQFFLALRELVIRFLHFFTPLG
jgi:hypothetical protein